MLIKKTFKLLLSLQSALLITGCSRCNDAIKESYVKWETDDNLLGFTVLNTRDSYDGFVTLEGEQIDCIYSFNVKGGLSIEFKNNEYESFSIQLAKYNYDLILTAYSNHEIFDEKKTTFNFYGERLNSISAEN